MPAAAIRLVSHESQDHAVRSSLSAKEQRTDAPTGCDRYEPCQGDRSCNDAPGALLYADYLERQNQRMALREQSRPTPQEIAPPAKPKPQPVDTGLAPRLGDIPDAPSARIDHKVKVAYQVMRYAPTGSLVDVTL
jgi:hypothetical protein